MVLGFAISYAIQRGITQPIAALAGTMDRVRIEQDYTQGAVIARDDEVGVLARHLPETVESLVAGRVGRHGSASHGCRRCDPNPAIHHGEGEVVGA